MQLFRALKTKGNTPKYGLIYHSSFIGRAAAKNKVRHSAASLRMNALGDADCSFGISPCQHHYVSVKTDAVWHSECVD